MVCNLWDYKGIDTFQEAFGEVMGEHPEIRALVIGRDVGTLAGLEERSRRLSISEEFRFLGERGDVCRLLSGMDVYVSASRGEGMSNAILEGMAHGLAVVGSRVGGTGELLDGGKAGLLFEAGDVKGLAGQMRVLVESPGERERL